MHSSRTSNFVQLTTTQLSEAFTQISDSENPGDSSLPKPPIGALAGIPIVGIVEHIAGPLALGTLTSEGAISVSIEPPSGDPARKYLSPECFATLHAGKMSVAMNLKNNPNYSKVLNEAAIIIDNRSKRARENDLALQEFLKDNNKPNRVIYCYISGFPGADESKPGNDVTVQAASGMAHVNAPEAGMPLKVGFMLLDFAAADWAVIAIQSRLIEMLRGIPIKEEENKVIPVHVNMASVAARFLSLHYLDALQGRELKPRTWNRDNYISIFTFFKTADNEHISIGTLSDAGFKNFCDQVIEMPELATRFPKNELRLNNDALVHEEIQKALSKQPLEYWMQKLKAHGIPHAPVERVEDVVKKPYAQHLFSQTTDGTPIIARPDGRKPALDPAPKLDQHGKILDRLIKLSEHLRQFPAKPNSEAPANRSKHSNLIASILAGAASGPLADALAFPLLRAKTVMQTEGAEHLKRTGKTPTQSLLGTLSTIYRTQGFLGLFRGYSYTFASSAPGTALFFSGMQVTKDWIQDSDSGKNLPPLFKKLLPTFAGQLAGSLVWVPSEVLRDLRQIDVAKAELQGLSITGLAKHVYRTEGIRGFYKGTSTQLATFAPFNFLGLFLANEMKSPLPKDLQSNMAVSLAVNGVAFGAAGVATNPIDVVKTRIQGRLSNPELFPERNPIKCAIQIAQTEGAKAFLSGASARGFWGLTRQGPAFAIFGKVYDHLTKPAPEDKKSIGPKI